MATNGSEVSFWGGGNVWKLGSGGVHSILQIYPKPPNSTVQTSEVYGMGLREEKLNFQSSMLHSFSVCYGKFFRICEI